MLTAVYLCTSQEVAVSFDQLLRWSTNSSWSDKLEEITRRRGSGSEPVIIGISNILIRENNDVISGLQQRGRTTSFRRAIEASWVVLVVTISTSQQYL
uniref:Uncharacterized protein n=1 Tax=Onchocerca volvulus TaxID=6282 RepID=A0A8R1TVB9_ONCVO